MWITNAIMSSFYWLKNIFENVVIAHLYEQFWISWSTQSARDPRTKWFESRGSLLWFMIRDPLTLKGFKMLPWSNQEDRHWARDHLQWRIQLFLLVQKYQQSCHDMHMTKQLLIQLLHNLKKLLIFMPYRLIEGFFTDLLFQHLPVIQPFSNYLCKKDFVFE